MLLILAFRKSVGWGLACLFLPFAALVFVIQNWAEAKTAFLTSAGGAVLMVLGVIAMPRPTAPYEPQQQASNAAPLEAASVPQAQPQPYQPPRSAYNPPPASQPQPVVAPVTTTTPTEPEKPRFEMVYIDRETKLYYSEKCKNKPEGVARVIKSVALKQGYTAARCR